MSGPLLVFTTDFGLADPYAGVMKGVAISINPLVRFIDLTHQIGPQNIAQGAFVLGVSHRFFPSDAVHVVVVDPGVGTNRRPVLLSTPAGRFVAPDNGVLSHVLSAYLEGPPATPGTVAVPPSLSAVHLTNRDYWLHPLSNTFHGRDVFAPVAAHLTLGVAPDELGEPSGTLTWLPMSTPVMAGEGITGAVVYQDVYGNLVTNIPGEAVTGHQNVTVTIKDRTIDGLSQSFHDPMAASQPGLVALVGSLGYLEIAAPSGNAAQALAVGPGEPVRVTFQTTP